jgi:riboflavin synthase
VFTGLVEEKGALLARTPRGDGARVTIGCTMGSAGAPLELGESIAVDGVCLTVDKAVRGGWEADCSSETLARTTLGSVAIGGAVNLERALALGARLGGHIVSGHVDGTGKIAQIAPHGDMLEVTIAMPAELARYVAEKGSIAVNGVSLTVNAASKDRFSVMLIPHTLQKTSLHALTLGARVNLEVDLLARYVARLLAIPASSSNAEQAVVPNADAALLEKLGRGGFM